MDVKTDLPLNYLDMNPNFDVAEPLQMLQTMLNKKNVDIESLDARSESDAHLVNDYNQGEFKLLLGSTNRNPQELITSRMVKDLNDRFNKDLDTSNPAFILSADRRTHNNINLIRTSNASFAGHRDLFAVRPPIDAQQRILDELKRN